MFVVDRKGAEEKIISSTIPPLPSFPMPFAFHKFRNEMCKKRLKRNRPWIVEKDGHSVFKNAMFVASPIGAQLVPE